MSVLEEQKKEVVEEVQKIVDALQEDIEIYECRLSRLRGCARRSQEARIERLKRVKTYFEFNKEKFYTLARAYFAEYPYARLVRFWASTHWANQWSLMGICLKIEKKNFRVTSEYVRKKGYSDTFYQ
jgi:hypothetical protein